MGCCIQCVLCLFEEQEAKQNGESGLEGLKSSMHPELVKYARETDQKNSFARKESRQNLFRIHPDFQSRYGKVGGLLSWLSTCFYFLKDMSECTSLVMTSTNIEFLLTTQV